MKTIFSFLLLALLAAPARAGLSLSATEQQFVLMADTDPLAPKREGPAVTGGPLTKDLPAPGRFYRLAVEPGAGGYPGGSIVFGQPVDFSRAEVLGVWFKTARPISYFQIVLNGANGVSEEFCLAALAARYEAFVRPGGWHLALLPFRTQLGWVRYGSAMDFSKIKSLTFYVADGTLAPGHGAYEFEFGGATLWDAAEAQAQASATFRYPVATTAARLSGSRDVRVWTADPGEKIFATTPFPQRAPRARAATASAAGHEYASLLWVIEPARNLTGLEAAAGPLVGAAGQIAATNITVRYVDSIAGPFLNYPDPLPLLNGKNLHTARGTNLMVWATVYVPPGTPRGLYRGAVTLTDAHGLRQSLPLELRVYGFTLPTPQHLKSLFTIQHLYSGPQWLTAHAEKYWGRPIAPYSPDYLTILHNVVRNFGEHRITPSLYQCPNLTDDDLLALRRQYGFDPLFFLYCNLVNAYFGHENMTAADRAKIVAALKAAGEQHRQRGETDLAVIKIADEPAAEHMPAVLMAAQDAHTAIPYIQSFITITSPQLPESLFGLVDTWCPVWGVFDFAGPQARARLAAGDRFWTYAAEYRSNDAYLPLDLRVPFWLYWKYGISGIHYSHHIHSVFLTYPNDTYPHADGLDEIPSIRWEMIRHGAQDYEYFWLLNDLLANQPGGAQRLRRLLQVPPTVAVDDKNYTTDPRPLLAQRDRIARAIEELQAR